MTEHASPSAPRRIPVAAIAAAVVLAGAALWYFGFYRQSAEPLTERDMVLVADFVNATGDPVFDDALRQAVAVQLQQSPFVALLSDQRLQRTLRLMQRPLDEAVTGDVAREACQRAGAKATVEGSIEGQGSNFAIALAVHNCQNAESLARQRVQAASKEDVLNQLGSAVKALRKDLGESFESIGRYDTAVTDATTRSLEALRAYGQGVRTRSTRGERESIPLFRQALEKDPGFALAYAKLGVVTGNLGLSDEAREHTKKAFELGGKVSEYERLYINWNYAARVLLDDKATRDALELLTTSYPRDFAARNNLGVYYNNRGELEEALKQYQAASAIAPDEPGPHSNAAYVLLVLGRIDEASVEVDRAMTMRPDGNLAIGRWVGARLANHPRAAEFELVARQVANQEQLAGADSGIAAWEGRFRDYDRIQGEMITRARAAGQELVATNIAVAQRILRAMYLRGADLAALKSLAAKEPDPELLAQYVSAIALLGEVGPARAALPRLAKSNSVAPATMSVTRALVMAKDGNIPGAIVELDRQLVQTPRAQELHFVIGTMNERLGDADAAIGRYRRVIAVAPALGANPIVPSARLNLAALLLKRNDTAGAKEQLDRLLMQWQKADSQFPMLAEAKALSAKIKD